MLPAGVDTNTPSETNFLIICLEPCLIDNEAACLLCLRTDTSLIAIDLIIWLFLVLTNISKGEIVTKFAFFKFLIISFSSDWLYTTKENKDIVIALNASGADVSYSEIITDKGHDSFLLDEPEFLKTLKSFIDSMYEKFKNEKRV